MAKLNERTFVGKKALVEAKSLPTTWDLARVRQLQADLEQLDGRKWDMAWTRSFRLWAEDGYPAVLNIEEDSGVITIEDAEKPQSWVVGKESTIEELLQLYKKVEQASKRSFKQDWSVVGNSKDEVLDQLMDRFEDIDQEVYDELFPNGVDWDTPWSEYAEDCISYFKLKSKIKKQKDGTYKLTLKKDPSDLLADYATTIRENFKSTIQEEIQNQDGWGDTVQDALEPVFSNLEDLMYEVRNAVRGSYAVNGDTVEDLVQELRDCIAQLEAATDDIEFESHAITEKLVEPSKEDLKPIEDKFAELGLEIEKQGKTLFGNTHYQLRKELDHPVTSKDLGPIFDELCELGNETMPTTCNVGVHRDGDNIISAAVDVLKKHVDDIVSQTFGEEFDPNTDGWREEILARLEPTLNRLGNILSDVRNGVRVSEGDLKAELKDCTDGLQRSVTNYINKTLKELQSDKEEVDESCKKEDNKLQEDAAMTDQERVKIFADYFDIEAEDCDYNAEDHTIESPVGDFYFGTYDEMVDRAIANESEMIDDMGLGLFTPNFRDEIVSDPELYNMHWFAEYWDDYNATADEEDEISYGDDEEAAQLYADTFGDEAFAAAVEKLLDKEAVAREVIRWDGVAGILAAYDGNEEDLGHGLYAYRWN